MFQSKAKESRSDQLKQSLTCSIQLMRGGKLPFIIRIVMTAAFENQMMTRNQRYLLNIVCFFGFLSLNGIPTVAAPPESLPAQSRLETRSTTELDNKTFSLRGRSTHELWQDHARYRDTVLAASQSDDPEAVQRARWVLSRWRRGIFVDTPVELAQQLSECSPAEAIELCLESGQFSAARIAIEEAMNTIDYQAIIATLENLLDRRFPIYARVAVQQQSETDFYFFLDSIASTQEQAVSRYQWLHVLLPTNADKQSLLPQSATRWDTETRVQAECLLNLMGNNIEGARRIAAQSNEAGGQPITSPESSQVNPLMRLVHITTGNWKALAQSMAVEARRVDRELKDLDQAGESQQDQAVMLASESVRSWSDVLVASSRCGLSELRDEAVAALTTAIIWQEKPLELPDEFSSLLWRSLCVHGYVDEALAELEKNNPHSASKLAFDVSQTERSITMLGFPPRNLDATLEGFIDRAIKVQRELHEASTSSEPGKRLWAAEKSASGLCDEVENLLTLMRLLIGVGNDVHAWRIAERLSANGLKSRSPRGRDEFLLRDHVLNTLVKTDRTDWMIKLGLQPWDKTPTLVVRALIAKACTVDDYDLIDQLFRLFKVSNKDLSDARVFQIACEIARADDPDIASHAARISELGEALRKGNLVERAGQTSGISNVNSVPDQRVWADLFIAHGRADLAETLILQDLAAAGDVQASWELTQSDRFDHGARDDVFESIWNTVAQPLNSTVDADSRLNRDESFDAIIGVRCVAQLYRNATGRGDQAGASILLRQLKAMACTPSTDARQQIAEVFAELGLWDEADEVYQSVLWMTALNSDETLSLIGIARRYQQFIQRATTYESGTPAAMTDPQATKHLADSDLQKRREALRWFDLAFAGTLSVSDYLATLYVLYPQMILRERLELSVTSADERRQDTSDDEVQEQLKQLLRFDRIDITTAEAVLPHLSKHGFSSEAEQFLDQTLAAAQDHLRTFPNDSMVANNVAWGAAVNNHRLADALDLSRRAVMIEPDSAIYRDTLAEILARLNETDQAIQIEEACLIDDQGQWHLHEQISRFQKRLDQHEN